MPHLCASGSRLATPVLIGIGVIVVVMLAEVRTFPANLGADGLASALATVGALVAYGGVALWARRSTTSAAAQRALRLGTCVGVILGVGAVANHIVEVFVAPGPQVSTILGVSLWGALFLAFGATASAAYHQTGSLRLALVASVWCAVVSTVAVVLAGYLIVLLFLPRETQILAAAFATSGMADAQAFVIRNTLSSGASHALLAPLVALAFGVAGTVASMVVARVPRWAVGPLATTAILLLGAGLAALSYASGLEREARPPFIMGGLLALGLTMAAAYPLVMATRRTAPPSS
jgi:hypothetical protein